jgi:hypothetical protein
MLYFFVTTGKWLSDWFIAERERLVFLFDDIE